MYGTGMFSDGDSASEYSEMTEAASVVSAVSVSDQITESQLTTSPLL